MALAQILNLIHFLTADCLLKNSSANVPNCSVSPITAGMIASGMLARFPSGEKFPVSAAGQSGLRNKWLRKSATRWQQS
jgi:hypothetical protein